MSGRFVKIRRKGGYGYIYDPDPPPTTEALLEVAATALAQANADIRELREAVAEIKGSSVEAVPDHLPFEDTVRVVNGVTNGASAACHRCLGRGWISKLPDLDECHCECPAGRALKASTL